MKILHVISSLNTGGAERALLRLLFCSQCDPKPIVVSLTSKGIIGQELEENGFVVIELGLKPYNIPVVFYRLYHLFKYHKPSLVQTWLYHADLLAGLAAKLAGVQHIVWGIRTTELRRGSYLTACIRKLLAWLSHWVPSNIVVVAEKAKLKHISIGYCASKMQVIPNGFDVNAFHVFSNDVHLLRQKIGVAQNDLVIGCVGRLSQDKGQDVFIQAADLVLRRFTHVKFLMVGRGLEPTNSAMKVWVSQTYQPKNFILLGERSDVPACLKAIDVFCLPSRSEGFPNALGEAMLMGVPCVSTDAGDASVLGGQDLPIARVDDATDLAEKLISMIEKNQQERDEIGQRLRQRIIDEYSIEKMVSRYAELYNGLEQQELKRKNN